MTEINKFTMELWELAIMTKRSHILYHAERLYLWVCQSLMFIYCPDLLYDQIKWPRSWLFHLKSLHFMSLLKKPAHQLQSIAKWLLQVFIFCLFLGPTKLWFQDWNKPQASCTYGRIIRLFLKIGILEKEKRNRWGDVWENSRGHEGAVDLTEDVWHHCRWYLQSRNFLRPGY